MDKHKILANGTRVYAHIHDGEGGGDVVEGMIQSAEFDNYNGYLSYNVFLENSENTTNIAFSNITVCKSLDIIPVNSWINFDGVKATIIQHIYVGNFVHKYVMRVNIDSKEKFNMNKQDLAIGYRNDHRIIRITD